MQKLSNSEIKALADAFNPAGQVYLDIRRDLDEFKLKDGEDDFAFDKRKGNLFKEEILLGLVFFFKSAAPYKLLTPGLKNAVDQKIQDNARRFAASVQQSTDSRLAELVKRYDGGGVPFLEYNRFLRMFVQKTLEARA